MQNIFDDVYYSFTRKYDNVVFVAPESTRDHIFYSIIEACGKGVDTISKMSMYHEFVTFEKILDMVRGSRPELGDLMLERYHKFHKKREGLPELGMSALYYPMIAFVVYGKKDYPKAIGYLDQSLQCLAELEKQGILDALYATTEQTLNKFRVYCSSKEKEKAIHTAACIILFVTCCNTATNNPVINGDIASLYAKEEWVSKYSTIHYYIGAIFNKAAAYEKETKEDLVPAITREVMARADWTNCPQRSLKEALGLVLMLEQPLTTATVTAFTHLLEDMKDLPRALNKYILNAFVNKMHASNYENAIEMELAAAKFLEEERTVQRLIAGQSKKEVA